jgi:hypothetical protein
MNLYKRISSLALLAIVGLALGACASQKDPAKQALDGADKAADLAARSDASKYTPEDVKELKRTVASLNASFDEGDYAGVLAGAPPLVDDAQALMQGAATRKEAALKQLNAQWSEMVIALPSLVDTVKTRMDLLGKAKRASTGVDLEAARLALLDTNALWDRAKTAFGAGQVEDAVNMGKEAKSKTEAAAADLNLQLPKAAMAGK